MSLCIKFHTLTRETHLLTLNVKNVSPVNCYSLERNMIPRIILNNIQFVKKFFLVSVLFFVIENLPLYEIGEVIRKSSLRETPVSEAEHLILLWTEYQILGKGIYSTIFKKINDKVCPIR